jgi:heme-degrading monooxygenase HmoA
MPMLTCAISARTCCHRSPPIHGHRGARVLRRDDGGQVEFLVMTFWDSMDAVRRFAGEDPERAVVEPEARAVLAEYDELVRHYEVER